MKYSLFFILGLVVAYLIWLAFRKKSPADDLQGNPLNPEVIAQRRRNLERIMTLASKNTQLTNDDVQKALGISDATATRYLGYLTDLGKLVRVGERGKQVYYQLPPR